MLNKIKKISNKLLAIGVMVAVLIVVLIGVDYYQKEKQKEGIAENNLLKAPKENIIDYEMKRAASAGENGTNQNIIVYHYVSNIEVPAATYQGLKEDLFKRTGNSQTFLKAVKPINDKLQQEEYVSKFYTSRSWQKNGGKWYQIETATTTPQAFASQTKLTLLDRTLEFFGQKVLADTFYAGAGDGQVAKSDVVWATAQTAIAGETFDYTGTTFIVSGSYDIIGSDYHVNRGFLPFNTGTVIPNNATIVSADLYVFLSLNFDVPNNIAYSNIFVLQSSQTNSAVLALADFNEAGVTSTPAEIDIGGQFDIASTTATTTIYTDVPLDSDGASWIKKSGETSNCGTTAGYTCLALRNGNDLFNIEPAPAGIHTTSIYSSEYAGTDHDPYLVVTYSTIAPAVIKIDGGTIKIDGGTIKIDG